MLDTHILRNQPEKVFENLKRRRAKLNIDSLTKLEAKRKKLQTELQDLQNKRNSLSKAVGMAKARGESGESMIAEVNQHNEKLQNIEEQFAQVQTELQAVYLQIPNITHESVPDGDSEDDNVEIRKYGDIPAFSFTPKSHHESGLDLELMDFERAAKLTGSRFVVLYKQFARMHRALIQLMLDTHTTQHGYQETYVPYIVNSTSLTGTGQLPKFAEEQFKLEGEQNYYLIPTSEVPLTNLYRDQIIDEAQLPMQFTAHTPCFRSEAGSYGKDTQGMIRQHQFEKVELVWLTKPEQSYDALEKMVRHAETILQLLKLPYRVVALCTADIGFSAAKTYDIEVWLPSQNKYREISSCSNCEAFQARRLQIRYRNSQTGKPELVHTLNGSGLAVGRSLVAIIENYQQADGSILIPEVLQPYMRGEKIITRESISKG